MGQDGQSLSTSGSSQSSRVCASLEAHQHVVILGPVGVGKTFMAHALGHIACQHGYRVRFLRADAMLRKLRQSRFDNSRDAEMVSLTTVDLLILDDFALEPMSKEESKDSEGNPLPPLAE